MLYVQVNSVFEKRFVKIELGLIQKRRDNFGNG